MFQQIQEAGQASLSPVQLGNLMQRCRKKVVAIGPVTTAELDNYCRARAQPPPVSDNTDPQDAGWHTPFISAYNAEIDKIYVHITTRLVAFTCFFVPILGRDV